MNSVIKTVMVLLVGGLLGGVTYYVPFYNDAGAEAKTGAEAKPEQKPLYWVAPMDPNYRRDKPGKSPMGMDLVPVYEEQKSSPAAGEVQIDSAVANNLGVKTAKAHKGLLTQQIQSVGYVQYDETRLVHLHPRVEGWIEKLYLNATGESVEKGQPVYALYSPELVNAQEEYLLALRRGSAPLMAAAAERLGALQFPADLLKKLKSSKKVMRLVTFHAPSGGVVDNLNVREGYYVMPGTTLMTIAALDEIWVEVQIPQSLSGRIAVGQQVEMSLDALPGRQWQGVVDHLYPTLDPKTRSLRVRVRFANPDLQLKPNMFAELTIATPQTQESLLIPKGAVIRTANQSRVVLALGEGRFKSVIVQPGEWGSELVEIIEGLQEGDEVVTSAQFLLDSESSKTADLERFEPVAHSGHQMMEHDEHSGHQMMMDDDEHSGHQMMMDDDEHSGHQMMMDDDEHSGHQMMMDDDEHSGHQMMMEHDEHSDHQMMMDDDEHSGHQMMMDDDEHSGHQMMEHDEHAGGHHD